MYYVALCSTDSGSRSFLHRKIGGSGKIFPFSWRSSQGRKNTQPVQNYRSTIRIIHHSPKTRCQHNVTIVFYIREDIYVKILIRIPGARFINDLQQPNGENTAQTLIAQLINKRYRLISRVVSYFRSIFSLRLLQFVDKSHPWSAQDTIMVGYCFYFED